MLFIFMSDRPDIKIKPGGEFFDGSYYRLYRQGNITDRKQKWFADSSLYENPRSLTTQFCITNYSLS